MTTSGTSPAVNLRPLLHHDRSLVRSWLLDHAVRTWWGTPSATEAEIAIALESESAICRMIEIDGTPVGYGHALDAGLLRPSDGSSAGEPGVWDCTFFIGSEQHRNHGIGAIALELLAAEVFSTTLAIAFETRVPVRNERAVREIEAKGFRWRRIEHDDVLGPFWIMRRERRY